MYVCVCMCVCIYIYIYTYTYTHTHLLVLIDCLYSCLLSPTSIGPPEDLGDLVVDPLVVGRQFMLPRVWVHV